MTMFPMMPGPSKPCFCPWWEDGERLRARECLRLPEPLSPIDSMEKLFGRRNPLSVQPQEKQTHQNRDEELDTLWFATSVLTTPTAESQSSNQVVRQFPGLNLARRWSNYNTRKTISATREIPKALWSEERQVPLCSSLMQNHEFMEQRTLEKCFLQVLLLHNSTRWLRPQYIYHTPQ